MIDEQKKAIASEKIFRSKPWPKPPLSQRQMAEVDIPDESAESGYRRGYRDALLKLCTAYDLLNIQQMSELYRWAMNGDLGRWMREIQMPDKLTLEIPPDFP